LLGVLTTGANACDDDNGRNSCNAETHKDVCNSAATGITQCKDGKLVDLICEKQVPSSKCVVSGGVASCTKDEDEDEVGKDCDENYVNKCVNNVALICNGTYVEAINCAEKAEGGKCGTLVEDGEDIVKCFKQCTQANEDTYRCGQEEQPFSISYIDRCYTLKDGSLGKTLHNTESCLNGCDEATGKCKKLHDEEGKPCNEKNYTEKCDNEIVLRCLDGKVDTVNCSELDKHHCKIEKDNKANCFISCDTLGEMFVCDHIYNRSDRYECVTLKDNTMGAKYVDVIETCDYNNGCDDATGKCKD